LRLVPKEDIAFGLPHTVPTDRYNVNVRTNEFPDSRSKSDGP
jgi:hypothetical protein